MIGFALHATFSGSGAQMAPEVGGAGTTTARWQDKGPRCAAFCGRGFSRGYGAFARGAPDRRSLRAPRFPNDFTGIARCAGPRR